MITTHLRKKFGLRDVLEAGEDLANEVYRLRQELDARSS
jgi:hypothetical protein